MKNALEKLFDACNANYCSDSFIVGLQERASFLLLADAPFRYEDYQVNYDGNVYVGQQVIADRNNLLLDHWSINVVSTNVNREQWVASAEVTITCAINGQVRSVTQIGVNRITIMKDNKEPKGDEIEQALKAAISDGMKKASSWLGIGSHVYRGDIIAVKANRKNGKPQNMEYVKLIETKGLKEADYEHGIPVLPDSYREFYEKMRWEGVFESDLLAVKKQLFAPEKDTNPDNQNPKQGPTPKRIKVIGKVIRQTNGSLKFKAMTQNQEIIDVIVPKPVADKFEKIDVNMVIVITKGSLSAKGILTVASDADVKIERRAA